METERTCERFVSCLMGEGMRQLCEVVSPCPYQPVGGERPIEYRTRGDFGGEGRWDNGELEDYRRMRDTTAFRPKPNPETKPRKKKSQLPKGGGHENPI